MDNNPLWYKDAVIYEVAIKSFLDSDNDGIGDLRGLIEKIDYIANLGANAIWLLPFFPSPLKDDGYDISDFCGIHPDYGTLKDFKDLLKAAHRRGIRVIIELVLNHTSNQHPWFQRARAAPPGSSWRNRYVWSDSPDKYAEARIIFPDFETSNWTWDAKAQAYYWHRFYSHQPDLNFDNPVVQREMLQVLDFWFEMGVDGMRLDAAPYLFEREGTNCENLPETHQFLKKLRAHVDRRFPGGLLLAEANQWPEDAAAYLGDGDECHMAFHFPLMPRMFMALQMEDSFPLIDILRSTPPIPDNCQWGIFLRNHDELTLEMVTDEERDYMYRVYALDPRTRINLGIRRRLAPLMNHNRRKIELMNILLFSLPGSPILYYGDEIGMGDNYYLGDRDGVRTPMQWSPDRNAGFSRVNPQQLYLPAIIDPEYHYEAINVENQEANLSSLLWWTRRVIAMRRRFPAFSRGSIEIIPSSNPRVLVFLRRREDEAILVVANLSRFIQVAAADLCAWRSFVLEEVFSKNRFPRIERRPYTFTLGPYGHFWLLLRRGRAAGARKEKFGLPKIETDEDWPALLTGKTAANLLENILPDFLRSRRWFGAKGHAFRALGIKENIPYPGGGRILLLEANFVDRMPESYLLPLFLADARDLGRAVTPGAVADLRAGSVRGILIDGTFHPRFQKALLELLLQGKKLKGKAGDLVGVEGGKLKKLVAGGDSLQPRILDAEQSNSAIIYGDRLFLKLYRRLEEGVNPEVEILRFLTEKTSFRHFPAFAGAIEYRRRGVRRPATVALFLQALESLSDAWIFVRDSAARFLERALATGENFPGGLKNHPLLPDGKRGDLLSPVEKLIGGLFREMVELLGKRTAELHLALGLAPDDKEFKPEPFSFLYQRAVYQSMQQLTRKTLAGVAKNLALVPKSLRSEVQSIIDSEKTILDRMRALAARRFGGRKIRVHGDYHLGQVLYTGKDFLIIDFEGEPARSLSERRLKQSPLKDVAGMIRSFHYAAYHSLFLGSGFRPEDIPALNTWVEPWFHLVRGIFLESYLKTISKSGLLPEDDRELETLLRVYLLEKAVYELGYELNHRPEWLSIPIRGILSLLD